MEFNDKVRIKPTKLNEKRWKLGKIVRVLPFRSYEVLTEDGEHIRRNRRYLRKTQEEFVLKQHDYEWDPSERHNDESSARSSETSERDRLNDNRRPYVTRSGRISRPPERYGYVTQR